MRNTLTIDSVQLQIGKAKFLNDIPLEVKTGEVIGLVGRNSEGKSSLLNTIYGTHSAQHSSIRINGISTPKAYLTNNLISYLPQFNFIPKALTLNRVFKDFNLSYSDFETWLPDFKQNPGPKIKHLSGGNRRILEIYLVVKSPTRFAILDEPFNALMPLYIDKVLELIKQEQTLKGFLISDQNYHKTAEISDRLYLLSNGKTRLINDWNELISFGYLPGKESSPEPSFYL